MSLHAKSVRMTMHAASRGGLVEPERHQRAQSVPPCRRRAEEFRRASLRTRALRCVLPFTLVTSFVDRIWPVCAGVGARSERDDTSVTEPDCSDLCHASSSSLFEDEDSLACLLQTQQRTNIRRHSGRNALRDEGQTGIAATPPSAEDHVDEISPSGVAARMPSLTTASSRVAMSVAASAATAAEELAAAMPTHISQLLPTTPLAARPQAVVAAAVASPAALSVPSVNASQSMPEPLRSSVLPVGFGANKTQAVNIETSTLLSGGRSRRGAGILKNKINLLVIELFPLAGPLGMDRFYLGATWTGLAKLLICISTCMVGGMVWYVIDVVAIIANALGKEHSIDTLGMHAEFGQDEIRPAWALGIVAIPVQILHCCGGGLVLARFGKFVKKHLMRLYQHTLSKDVPPAAASDEHGDRR